MNTGSNHKMLGSRPLSFNVLWFEKERMWICFKKSPYAAEQTFQSDMADWKTLYIDKLSYGMVLRFLREDRYLDCDTIYCVSNRFLPRTFFFIFFRFFKELNWVVFKTKHVAVWLMSNIDRASQYTFPYLNLSHFVAILDF